MAEIAVKPKAPRTRAWGALALLGLAFIAVALYLKSRESGEGERYRTANEPVMRLAELRGEEAGSLAGRRAEIKDARVLSVTGDRVFWVGDSESEQVLVVLQEVPTPGRPHMEGRYDVNAGQTIDIYGTVERFPGWSEAQTRWNADPALRQQFEEQQVYVHAETLSITHRP